MVLFPEWKTLLLAFFPVFILDLVDLLSAQQMPETLLLQYNSTSLSSLPWTCHYARSLCSVRARNGERKEGRDVTYTELTPIPGFTQPVFTILRKRS